MMPTLSLTPVWTIILAVGVFCLRTAERFFIRSIEDGSGPRP